MYCLTGNKKVGNRKNAQSPNRIDCPANTC